MEPGNRFSEYDAGFTVWTAVRSDALLYGTIKKTLRRLGFGWVQDPRVKRAYPCLAKTHHYGMRGDLQFTAEVHPALIRLQFFQDVAAVNPHGGRHDFNKLGLMPYLVRKRYEHTAAAVRATLLACGFADATKEAPRTAMDRVRLDRADTYHREFWLNKQPYDARDADGVVMADGDFRYFYDLTTGRLSKGRVYHRLGNVPFLVSNARTVTCCYQGEIFSPRPGLPRRRPRDPAGRVKRLVDRAAAREDYAEAARLQAVLAKTTAAGPGVPV